VPDPSDGGELAELPEAEPAPSASPTDSIRRERQDASVPGVQVSPTNLSIPILSPGPAQKIAAPANLLAASCATVPSVFKREKPATEKVSVGSSVCRAAPRNELMGSQPDRQFAVKNAHASPESDDAQFAVANAAPRTVSLETTSGILVPCAADKNIVDMPAAELAIASLNDRYAASAAQDGVVQSAGGRFVHTGIQIMRSEPKKKHHLVGLGAPMNNSATHELSTGTSAKHEHSSTPAFKMDPGQIIDSESRLVLPRDAPVISTCTMAPKTDTNTAAIAAGPPSPLVAASSAAAATSGAELHDIGPLSLDAASAPATAPCGDPSIPTKSPSSHPHGDPNVIRQNVLFGAGQSLFQKTESVLPSAIRLIDNSPPLDSTGPSVTASPVNPHTNTSCVLEEAAISLVPPVQDVVQPVEEDTTSSKLENTTERARFRIACPENPQHSIAANPRLEIADGRQVTSAEPPVCEKDSSERKSKTADLVVNSAESASLSANAILNSGQALLKVAKAVPPGLLSQCPSIPTAREAVNENPGRQPCAAADSPAVGVLPELGSNMQPHKQTLPLTMTTVDPALGVRSVVDGEKPPASSVSHLPEVAAVLNTPRWASLVAEAEELRLNWVHPTDSFQVETDVLHMCRAILKNTKFNVTQSFVSGHSLVSQGTLSHYIRGRFKGNQGAVEERLLVFIKRYAAGELDEFVPEHVERRTETARRPDSARRGGRGRPSRAAMLPSPVGVLRQTSSLAPSPSPLSCPPNHIDQLAAVSTDRNDRYVGYIAGQSISQNPVTPGDYSFRNGAAAAAGTMHHGTVLNQTQNQGLALGYETNQIHQNAVPQRSPDSFASGVSAVAHLGRQQQNVWQAAPEGAHATQYIQVAQGQHQQNPQTYQATLIQPAHTSRGEALSTDKTVANPPRLVPRQLTNGSFPKSLLPGQALMQSQGHLSGTIVQQDFGNHAGPDLKKDSGCISSSQHHPATFGSSDAFGQPSALTNQYPIATALAKRPRSVYGTPLPDQLKHMSPTIATECAFHAFKVEKWTGTNDHVEPLLVPIEIYVEQGGRVLHMFTQWDANERYLTPEHVAERIVWSRGFPKSFSVPVAALLRRRLFEAGVVPPPPPLDIYVERENLRKVKLVIDLEEDGRIQVLRDSFEWDIGAGPLNSPEIFAQSLCSDAGISQKHAATVAHAIRRELSFANALAYGDAETRSLAEAQLNVADPIREQLPVVDSAIKDLTLQEQRLQQREENEITVRNLFVKPLLTEILVEAHRREIERERAVAVETQRKLDEAARAKVAADAEKRRTEMEKAAKERNAFEARVLKDLEIDIRPYSQLKLGYDSHPGIWIEGLLERQRMGDPLFPASGAVLETTINAKQPAACVESAETAKQSKPTKEVYAHPKDAVISISNAESSDGSRPRIRVKMNGVTIPSQRDEEDDSSAVPGLVKGSVSFKFGESDSDRPTKRQARDLRPSTFLHLRIRAPSAEFSSRRRKLPLRLPLRNLVIPPRQETLD
jgi:SNF5 / SMARCB1 / INI1